MFRAGMKNFRIVDGPSLDQIRSHLFDLGERKQLCFVSEEGHRHFVFLMGAKRPKSSKKTVWLLEGEIPISWNEKNVFKDAIMSVNIQYDISTMTGKMRVPNGYFRPSR